MKIFSKKSLFFFLLPLCLFGQEEKIGVETSPLQAPPQAAEKIEIKPLARDVEIRERLENILRATGWFTDVFVEVREGVVTLFGKTKTEEFKKWAGDLARNTQNVVAVVNKIEVIEAPLWDFSIVTRVLQSHLHDFIRALPAILAGMMVLFLSWLLAYFSAKCTRNLLQSVVPGLRAGDIYK